MVQERVSKIKKPKAKTAVNALAVETERIALPHDGKATNFYRTGRVVGPTGKYSLQRVQVDGGSVVNLMPEDIAKTMNLMFYKSTDLMIKTADAQLTPIH